MHVIYSHERTMTLCIDLTPHDPSSHPSSPDFRCSIYHFPSNACVEVAPSSLLPNDTPYDSRGWCVAELQASQSRHGVPGRPPTQRLVGRYPDVYVEDMEAQVPMPPEVFRARAEQGQLRFSDPGDLEVALRLQSEAFRKTSGRFESLSLSELEAASRPMRCGAFSLTSCVFFGRTATYPHPWVGFLF